jgi:hypothetical protein
MTVRRPLFRRLVPALFALSLAAIFVPASASAGTSPSPSASASGSMSENPVFTIWTPGTPLPTVPAGYTLMLWPPEQVMKTVQVGGSVPVTAMTSTQAAQFAATPASYTAMENSAGLVNLELAPTPDSCLITGNVLKQDLGQTLISVMQSYSTVVEADQYFVYGNGRSSSLGIGYSVSGNAGTFTAGGVTSVSTDNQQDFAIQYNRSFNHFQTEFEIGKYYQYNFCPQLDKWLVMPFAWNCGTGYNHPSGAPSATHCVPEHANDHFTKNTTKATTFSIGYTAPILAFSGSAQIGYTGTASIRFGFGATEQLCGVLAPPTQTPGVMVAS